MLGWLARIKQRRQEEARQLEQQRVEDSISAFDPPPCPYILLMEVGYFTRLIEVNLQRGGLETRRAKTNHEALAKMKIAKPHVLICYTGMCDSDGEELLKSIRSTPELADIAVVVVAQTREQNELLMEMKDLGATACFPIPFVPLEFVTAIGRLM